MNFNKHIVGKHFFPKYAPQVRNWKHKSRGIDGNKKPITFSDEDLASIKIGIEKMAKDFLGWDVKQDVKAVKKDTYTKWVRNFSSLRGQSNNGEISLDIFIQKELLDDLKN